MKIIQFKNDIVIDILNTREDTTIDTIAVVDSIPEFAPREGYNGILKYNTESGLYWDYEEIVVDDTIPDEEFVDMIEEIM